MIDGGRERVGKGKGEGEMGGGSALFSSVWAGLVGWLAGWFVYGLGLFLFLFLGLGLGLGFVDSEEARMGWDGG